MPSGDTYSVTPEIARNVIECARRLGAPIAKGATSQDAFVFALGTIMGRVWIKEALLDKGDA